jgi:hypothetical protein
VSFQPNPPWVDRIVRDNWAALERLVGRDRMPVERESSSPRKRHVEEYGCGHYGCVAPTRSKEHVVFKLTSDPLEAHFVAAAIGIGRWPEGIVRYDRIVQVRGKYRGRPVFALWREEAFDVGEMRSFFVGHPMFNQLSDYDQRAMREFQDRIGQFQYWAKWFKTSIDRTARPHAEVLAEMRAAEQFAFDRVGLDTLDGKGLYRSGWNLGQKLAVYLRSCEIVAEMMANEPGGYLIGQALEFYLEHGLLLADLHLGNIGHVVREDYAEPFWAITDPGHAVPLDDRFAAVRILSV